MSSLDRHTTENYKHPICLTPENEVSRKQTGSSLSSGQAGKVLGSRLGTNWEGRPAALPSPAARGRCPAALRPPGEEAPPLPP